MRGLDLGCLQLVLLTFEMTLGVGWAGQDEATSGGAQEDPGRAASRACHVYLPGLPVHLCLHPALGMPSAWGSARQRPHCPVPGGRSPVPCGREAKPCPLGRWPHSGLSRSRGLALRHPRAGAGSAPTGTSRPHLVPSHCREVSVREKRPSSETSAVVTAFAGDALRAGLLFHRVAQLLAGRGLPGPLNLPSEGGCRL